MIDWNKQPRHAVERAAEAGDVGAQTVLRVHQSLDRIESGVNKLRKDILASYDRLEKQLSEAIKSL
jgi:hypothetical protein